MKCPQCATSQKAKEGTRCAKCGYQHVFQPKVDGTTDGKFLGLLKKASSNDTYYFTFNQLYTVWAEGGGSSISSAGGCAVAMAVLMSVAGLITGIGALADDMPELLLLVLVIWPLGGFLIWWGLRQREPPDPAKLTGLVEKWRAAGKAIPRLIERPGLTQAPGSYREADMFDYGAERILVVEHDILVDLLVRNNVHAEQRAIVVSERGYPSYVVPHVQRLLAQRPDVTVTLLHDATPHGTAMAQRLQQSTIVPVRGHRVVDAGLFPGDVPNIPRLKALGAQQRGNVVPADALPTGLLVGGLAGALGAGALLATGLAAADQAQQRGEADFG